MKTMELEPLPAPLSRTSMKPRETRRRTSLAILALLAIGLVAPGFGQSAVTDPVGVLRVTVPQAPAAGQFEIAPISVPLLRSSVYRASYEVANDATGANGLTDASATWTPSEFIGASNPHCLHFRSGNLEGFAFLITANSATSLTVDSGAVDISSLIADGDLWEIRPLHTIKTLFGDSAATVPFKQNANAGIADNVLVRRGGTWLIFWFNGTIWRRGGLFGDAGNEVIMPDTGIVIYRRDENSGVTLTFSGDVRTNDAILQTSVGDAAAVANPFPVPLTIGQFGFDDLPGWAKNAAQASADNVYVRQNNVWRIFWHDGTIWRRSGLFGNADIPSEAIEAGASVVVVRQAGAPDSGFAVVDLPFVL